MRYLLFLLIALPLLGASVDTKDGTAITTSTTLDGETGIDTADGQAITAGSSGQSFSDDFSTDPSSRWTTLTGSSYTWDSGDENIDIPASSSHIYTSSQVDTLNQWAFVQFVGSLASVYAGPVVRSTNNSGDDAYALRVENIGTLKLRSINGHTGVNDIYSWSRTLHVSDYIGITVKGTGASTEFVLYDFGATPPPGGPDDYTWDDYDDAKLTVNSGNWIDNTEPADTGKYAGLYNGGGANTFDNWQAGDWTP